MRHKQIIACHLASAVVSLAVGTGVSRAQAAAAAAHIEGLGSRYMTDRETAVKALVAVGADQQKEMVPAIAKQIEGGNWLTQHAAARVLKAYGPRASAAAPVLEKAALAGLKINRVSRVKVMVDTLAGIGAGGMDAVADAAVARLSEENPLAVEAALTALQAGGKTAAKAIPTVTKVLKGKDERLAASAADALGSMGPVAEPAVPALTTALGGDRVKVARSAATALGKIGPPAAKAVPALTAAVGKDDGPLAGQAAKALGAMGQSAEPAVPALIAALGHQNDFAADNAAEALKGLGQAGVRGAIGGLRHSNPDVVVGSIGIIEGAKAKTAVDPLVKMLKHKDGRVVNAACRALLAIDESKRVAVMGAWGGNIRSTDEGAACQAADMLSKAAAASSDAGLRRNAVLALVDALRNRKGALKRTAIIGLGRMGPEAEPGAKLIQEVIYGKEFRNEAIEAMKKIRPGKPIQLKPKAGGLGAGASDDLGLDL